MSMLTIILFNVAAAAVLSAILAALMLSPARLRRHFEHGYAHLREDALRLDQGVRAAERQLRRHPRPTQRPVEEV